MPVTASGPYSLVIEALASLITASTTFQSWVTASRSGLTADDHVYRIAVTGQVPEGLIRPHAMIIVPKGAMMRRGGYLQASIELLFERDVPGQHAESHQDAAVDFLNGLGAIAQEIVIWAEAGGALFIPDGGFETLFEPQRSYRAEQEDYFQAGFKVACGTR